MQRLSKNETRMPIVDFLPEDPVISGQKFALVTIVGPDMPQKCDVWGIKVRGVSDTLEEAASLVKKLMTIDPDFDVYTVEVGKFFPLVVDKTKIKNTQYQNSALNDLLKTYSENKEAANIEWERQKNERVAAATSEGSAERADERAQAEITELEKLVEKLKTDLDLKKQALSGAKSHPVGRKSPHPTC
jgi:hypothetical protein